MMRKLIVIAALLAAGLSHGANLEYDRMAAARQDALASLLVRTVVCMRQGAQALLQGGQRDENAIAQWLVDTCAMPLGLFMVSDMGFTQKDAATYIFAMGVQAVRESPGVRVRP